MRVYAFSVCCPHGDVHMHTEAGVKILCLAVYHLMDTLLSLMPPFEWSLAGPVRPPSTVA